MKNILQIIIFILFSNFCQSQSFNVNHQEIQINIAGRPSPWLKYKDKFYCYFSTDNDKFSSGSTHHFYIIDDGGNIETKINVPKELQTFYYDLYVKNDSIFTTAYMSHDTFYLDEINKKWIETKKGEDLFYSDDNYNVYSLNFGEWGGVTWFKNNKTNDQYELGGARPIVNSLHNTYYVTQGKRILKITDPSKMELSKEPYNYKNAVLDEHYFREGSGSLKGTKIIYEYKNDDYFRPKFSFATSFIADKKLFNIYTDSISTKIGLVENHQLIPVYEFQKEIKPFQWNYDWRNPIQNNKYQTIQFATDNQNEYGIIEISENNLIVTTFKNSYKENVWSEKAMEEWFEKTFEFYLKNFDNLYLKDIDDLELKVKSTDLTQNHMMTHYLLKGRDIQTPRIYRKIEDASLKLNTMYYYQTSDKSVKLIEFEWGRNNNRFNKIEEAIADSFKEDNYKSFYKSKFVWLSEFLIKKLGKPSKNQKDKTSATQQWSIKDNVVELFYNDNLVQVTLYKK